MKKKMIIKINGMSCMHCANTVTTALENIDNIIKVKVDLKKKEAVITYQNDIDINVIKDTINNLDYDFVEALPC